MSPFDSPAAFADALADLPGPDAAARELALERQAQLTKPPGSLGRLEDIAVAIAGWQGRAVPDIRRGQAIVFAGNHGVVARGVSAYPPAVTAQMVANFAAGGAAINALATVAGLDLTVEAIDLDHPTEDFTRQPAMSVDDCLAAMARGGAAIGGETDLLVLGEMGIGNSTVAAALCAASLGGSGSDWSGPGTGVDRAGVVRKAEMVDAGLTRHAGALATPFDILRRLGGREQAAIAGAVLIARLRRIPVVLDGFICCAAIAPLVRGNVAIVDHCIAGHVSAEPGHARLLRHFGLAPLLSLDMRLGEASGAAVAVGVIRAALTAHAGMATFAQAGVTEA